MSSSSARVLLISRLRRIAGWILLVGLAGAFVIYLVAPAATEDVLGDPADSKKYLHDMELYGGKANVLQDEFRRWFDGLWHGKSLAGTVAFLSLISALGLFVVADQIHAGPARRAPAPRPPLRVVPPPEDRPGGNDRDAGED